VDGAISSTKFRRIGRAAAKAQKLKIEVTVDPENHFNGRFARLHNPKGNSIELWESASPS